ncbi:MAG: HU family DNA-binding protein [Mycoplasma sp.]|nr:HU family DNA-binding protein [Mycoplasma sp.]
MNKAELVEALVQKTSFTKADAEKAIKALVEVVVEATKSGEKLTLVGLGTFEKKRRNARNGINPATKETIQIAAKDVPTFKAAKAFKEAVA